MNQYMLKKILCILTLAIFVLSGCTKKATESDLYDSILQKNKIIVGISLDSKPFGFKASNGQIQGFEADLAREIAYRILEDKNSIEFKDITPQERINAAKSGDVDMVIATMTITPQRKKIVDFSSPYFVAGQVICVRKDSKIDSHFDLNNKRVIVILGTTGEKNIKRFAPNVLIEGYSNNEDALREFENGSADAITTDDSLLQGLINKSSDYMFLPERLTREPYGIAFRKAKQTKTFKYKLNQILTEMRYDGTIDKLKDKWGIY